MDIIEEIINLPVIIQGALGSLLFWMLFETSKLLINRFLEYSVKFNQKLKKELLLHEKLSLMQDLLPIDSILNNTARTMSIHAALNRLIQGIIYICIGLIASEFIGSFSVLAYIFAVYYLFLALKACQLEISNDLTREDKEERARKIETELKKLNEKTGKDPV